MRPTVSTTRHFFWILRTLVVAALLLPSLGVTADEVELRLDLHKGDTFRQIMTMEQVTDQDVNGQQILTENVMTFESTVKVAQERDDGSVRIEATNDRIIAEVDGPQGQGKYDSDDGGAPANIMLAPFAAMAGKTFAYDLSSMGKVSNVEGFDGLAEELTAGMPVPDEAKKVIVNMLKKQLNDETMGQMLEVNHAGYPDGPLAVGEGWEQNHALGGIMPVELAVTYTLTDATATTATAAMAGKLSTPDGATLEMMPGVEMQLKLTGTQEGEVVYDRSNGWLQSMTTDQHLKGNIHIPDAGNGQELTIPMTVDTSTTLKTLPND